MIHVVIGIICKENKVLIAKRPPDKPQAGLWEFPGGKVETAESSFQALTRELQEEIGIDVINATPWLQFEFPYPDKTIFLDAWMIHHFSNEPRGIEGQMLRWVFFHELSKYTFPAANRQICESLQHS